MNNFKLSRRQLLVLASVFGMSPAVTARNFAATDSTASPRSGQGHTLQSAMIWAAGTDPDHPHFVAFRKRFQLTELPKDPQLDIFADVRYMLWINGEYVSRGPARFNPKGPEFDTIPLAAYLRAGANTIAVLAMAQASNGKMMLHAPGLTAILKSAGRTLLKTDPTWKWSRNTRYGPPDIDWADVHDRIDTRVEDGDWTEEGYDDSSWSAAVAINGAQWGELTPRRIPLLRETRLDPKFVNGEVLPLTLHTGEEVSFDLGRLAQAYTTLEIDAQADSTFTLDHAGISYTARAGRQSYLSSDTCAFQTGSLKVTEGQVTIHALGAVERVYPFDLVGSFQCDDPLLNDIWDMCARSVMVMSEDAYVDCADRERVEWMDNDPPAFEITRTAFAGPGVAEGNGIPADARLLEELLRRTALTQQPDGWVKAHTCSDRFDIHAYMEDRSCDWVEGARRYYESTHKTEVIREIWPVITTQMDWFLNHRTERGLVRAREWVVWGNPMGYQTCEGAGLNAFVYKALVDAAYLGDVIGEKIQATKFADAAKELAAEFNKVLWDETNGTYYSGFFGPDDTPVTNNFTHFELKVNDGLAEPTMFPALFALDQKIVPADRVTRVTEYLLANRSQATRIMTFYYLFKQMYQQNNPLLDEEILDTMRTKWHDMARTGWKVSWEDFSGGSDAHIYGSFPGYFLSTYVLGVRLFGPVWKRRLLIEPRLGNLKSASGVVVTEFGPVPVTWKVEGNELAFSLTVPSDVSATLRFASKSYSGLRIDGKEATSKIVDGYHSLILHAGKHEGAISLSSA